MSHLFLIPFINMQYKKIYFIFTPEYLKNKRATPYKHKKKMFDPFK